MTDSPEDYELFHYGVKGMKWGVIRDNVGSSVRSGAKTVVERPRVAAAATGRTAKKVVKSYGWTNREQADVRAQKVLNKYGGSKVKAITHVTATAFGKNVASIGIASASMLVPVAGLATGTAATAGAVGTTGRHIQDVKAIVRNGR